MGGLASALHNHPDRAPVGGKFLAIEALQQTAHALTRDKTAKHVGVSYADAGTLADFTRASWHVLEPTTRLVWGWHIDAVCQHVEAALLGWIEYQKWQQRRDAHPEENAPTQLINDLLINIPPGSMKSRILNVCAASWMWLMWPSWRLLCLSGNTNNVMRDATYCRDLISSDWYQSTFRPTWKLREDTSAKGNYWNTAGGVRQAGTMLGRITGNRADALFIDDPNEATEVYSDAYRNGINERWDQAICNRVNDPVCSVRIGIMQRLHEDDWAGHVLKQSGWQHLCIPMEYEPERYEAGAHDAIPAVTVLGWSDPRSMTGELMCPRRFPPNVIATEKTRLATRGYAGQHQQRPSPATGMIWQRHWWRYWQRPGDDLPPVMVKMPDGSYKTIAPVVLPRIEEELQSWDMSFTDAATSSFVVGQTWGRTGARKFLLAQVREQMGFSRTQAAVRAFADAHPNAAAKLIEKKANGAAIIETLEATVAGIIPITPTESKAARMQSCEPEIEAGNVFLPHPHIAPWVTGFVDECASAPNGAHDDQADAASQALNRMRKSSGDNVAPIGIGDREGSYFNF